MALSPRLDLRQTQSLVMTPQLQQAIKLLQLSSLDLASYVDTQLEQNPLLEREDAAGDGPVDGEAAAVPETVSDGDPRSLDEAVNGDDAVGYMEASLDVEYFDNVFDADGTGGGDPGPSAAISGPAGGGRGGSFEDHDGSFEDMLSKRVTLQEHLTSQLAIDFDDPIDRIIGVHLIDLLDEAGYLTGSLDTLAELLGCPVERIERTLYRLQRFDPAGVFARSLAECLALQLRERRRLDKPMQILLDHLDLVGKRDWPALARFTGIAPEQVAQLVAELRTLNPKPALVFDHTVAQPVTPDVLMRAQPGGGWLIELNAETLPRLLVNNQYYTHVSRTIRRKEDKQYINECLQSANWLVKSLHQRAATILKVASEIVRQQHEFFVNGVHGLKPLVLRDIAEAIGMHESTVSRVTANKYIATPRGIYELKYFFTHAVGGGQGGDAHSAESVRHRLRSLIDSESATNILSDDALAEMLQKDGIDIARRTVAKYREAMGISSSVQRRREKAHGF